MSTQTNQFVLIILFSLINLTSTATDIYVSSKGNDYNVGSKEKPLATLHSALRKARELRRLKDPTIQNGIKIYVENGVYQLSEPIVLRPEDSGTKESRTEIINLSNQKVIFSGGITLKGWKKVTSNVAGLPKKAIGKIWSVDLPSPGGQNLLFRQLWVNDKKAIRAKDKNGDSMGRILSWDAKNQTCKIPLGQNINVAAMAGMEMIIHQWWAIANLRIKSAKVIEKAIELTFMQPESRIQSEHPWPAPWISAKTGNSAFYLTNSIQFLDEPGEWFEDLRNQKLYYWPRNGEQTSTVKAVVPQLETLLKIEGTIDHPVQYITFRGISFQHSTWLRPSKEGHVPHQAGMYMLDAYKLKIPGTADKATLENQAWVGRPASAVLLNYANNTLFENCRFEHFASTGLDLNKGTTENIVRGSLFKDIGGSGILVGTFSDEATEVHLPYNPKDLREVATNNTIENNLITDVTNEDWGAVGIGAGYVSDLKIINNEINEVNYSGISMGWGWTKTPNVMKNNLISANKIHHYGKKMYDVAGIYMLSAQPESQIVNNAIFDIYDATYAHLPDHWFYIYTDEGSSGITIKNNYTPAQKYLQNANGPDNVWENNGADVVKSIRENAGLQKDFQYLLKYNSSPSATQKIKTAEAKQVVFELIFKDKNVPSEKEISVFARENNLLQTDFYQWNNRLLVYTNSLKIESLNQTLKRFKATELKLYDDLFYNFNREKNCGLATVKEWDHVILSANLVADEKLQKEYLAYHKTQFEKWPELSKGFCNADFQQLVIFKNGRQLMLIISIPKGANLDELNPKTTENNPRVDEWNKLMSKYQEGFEGAKKDEVWVFFDKIK
ncbi:L-rhamnose mutarotase [Pedobacter cryotolerans]|uniref:L-rhamnose mutarotase n=2 Tax=Pedobacter cryotolerans TaxID=2571270 RepID=A0A4U1CET2_9SPHI|nr:L-rhamnose mutarotase [Pedobacter cryotolerans]